MALEELRDKIDKIDSKIIELLEERLVLAKKIGTSKRKRGQQIIDPKRE